MQNTIMFIDDKKCILESLKWLFRDEPYQLETFDSPMRALLKLEETEAAVVVSDQWMPEMRGTEFLDRVMKKWPNTIRLIMTVNADDTVLAAVEKKKVNQVVFKPWDKDEMKLVISGAVNRHIESQGKQRM
jgi:DNA-binding NtrC family response regulator